MEVSEIAITVTAVTVNSGALIAFWVWARAQLTKVSEQVAGHDKWLQGIDARCAERKDNFSIIFQKIDDVKSHVDSTSDSLHNKIDSIKACFYSADNKTAKAIGQLEGQMSAVIERVNHQGGSVQT